VGTEGNHTLGLLALVASKDLLYGRRQIVITDRSEDTAKVSERMLMRFEKRLLCGVRVSAVKSSAAVHTTHRKELQPSSFASQLYLRFKPIDLGFLAGGIALRNTHLALS